MRVRYLLMLALAPGLVDCSLLGPSELAVEIRMDSTAYHHPGPGPSTNISFQVVNVGSVSAHFEGCPDPLPVAFERDASGKWEDDVSANIRCLAIFTPTHLELRPGRAYHYAVNWDRPSRYRFRVYFGDSATEPYRYSTVGAPFELR